MYGKIFDQIFDSSIVEMPATRFTFMDLIVLADPNGVVDMTHEAIARRTNRSLDVIKKTIAELESPDLKSRTPDFQGARIKRLDDHREWGWMILNYDKFRQTASEQQRREKTLDRVHKHREINGVTQVKRTVTLRNACNAKKKKKNMEKKSEESASHSCALPCAFDSFWEAYPKKKNKGDAKRAWLRVKKPISLILAAIETGLKSEEWTKDNGQFIPYPASWLNAEGWEDQPTVKQGQVFREV